jgi:UDP-N-acetylglucosamine acyltransferase
MQVHPTAIISPKAIIAPDVKIGPYCIIEEGVKLGRGTELTAYVHIKGNTSIGENNLIHTGCVIGEKPQMLGLRKKIGRLVIGNQNIIREYVSIHTSTSEEKETRLGDHNYIMGFSHIAHDCQIGNQVVICNGSLLAGHVEIQDRAFISGNVVIHQFARIGRLSMIAGLSRVNQDLPPFMLLVGNSTVWGINLVGLKRAGFSAQEIREIKRAFSILYRERLPLTRSLQKLKEIDSLNVREIVEFISDSQRGISGAKNSSWAEKLFLDYPLLIRNQIQTYRIIKRTFSRSQI